jgi:flagellar basal body-associated protein FliL
MAVETADPTNIDSNDHTPGGSNNASGGSKKLKLLALLLFVMGVEAAVLYMWFPPPGSQDSASSEDGRASAEADRLTAGVETVEVPIGSDTFTCTNTKAAVGAVVHVTFKLYAIVSRREEAEFSQAVRSHEARLRQAVITVARSSNREDLDDPNLSTIKRLMRERINKVLKKSFVIEVVVSEYKTMEQ